MPMAWQPNVSWAGSSSGSSSPSSGGGGGSPHGDGWNIHTRPVSRPVSMPPMLTWTGGGGQPPVDTSGDGSGSGSGDGSGSGVNTINQVIESAVAPPTQAELQKIQDDKVWALAELEASNPKYGLSYEGKIMSAAGYKPGDKEWTAKFGLGSIVGTNTGEWKKDQTTGQWKFTAPEGMRSTRTGDYIYTGLGQTILDQGNVTTAPGYEQAKGDYWRTRTEQERFEEDQRYDYGNRGRRNDDYMSSGSYASLAGLSHPLAFFRGRPENINPAWRDVAGTPMLPVAGSGAGASMATADELYSLASGNKAFSMDPNAQGILAILNS